MKMQAAKIKALEAEVATLRDEATKRSFSPDALLPTDEAVRFYTGLMDKATFDHVLQYLSPKAEKMHYWREKGKDYNKAKVKTGKQRGTTIAVEFLAVMVRLKVGLLTHDIAARMGVSKAHFSRIFTSWIRLLRLEMQSLCRFPTRYEVRHHMSPECSKYTNLRAIIDCTEFFTETPSSLTAQRETWSSYKSHNTLKVCYDAVLVTHINLYILREVLTCHIQIR